MTMSTSVSPANRHTPIQLIFFFFSLAPLEPISNRQPDQPIRTDSDLEAGYCLVSGLTGFRFVDVILIMCSKKAN